MNWTKEKPTEPGWYLISRGGDPVLINIVLLDTYPTATLARCKTMGTNDGSEIKFYESLDEFYEGTCFYGPIKEPLR